MTLYAATSNQGKLAEFATAALPSGVKVEALPNLAQIPEPIEDAATFLGNAELKARAYSLTLPGQLIFADDSGLEVQTLQNELGSVPGVRSARYAEDLHFEPGLGTKDERNNRALLHHMLAHAERQARFLCALALARDGQILLVAEGSCEGQLLHAPHGAGGFGYDSLFLLPALGLTFAELPREQKWQLSHRGNAFRALLAKLAAAAL